MIVVVVVVVVVNRYRALPGIASCSYHDCCLLCLKLCTGLFCFICQHLLFVDFVVAVVNVAVDC